MAFSIADYFYHFSKMLFIRYLLFNCNFICLFIFIVYYLFHAVSSISRASISAVILIRSHRFNELYIHDRDCDVKVYRHAKFRLSC